MLTVTAQEVGGRGSELGFRLQGSLAIGAIGALHFSVATKSLEPYRLLKETQGRRGRRSSRSGTTSAGSTSLRGATIADGGRPEECVRRTTREGGRHQSVHVK